MDFVKEAVERAEKINVELFICSPFLDNETLDDIYEITRNASKLQVICFFRQKEYDDSLSRKNKDRFPNTPYTGQYFHTKWAAYRAVNDDDGPVKLLLTSANLIIHHHDRIGGRNTGRF